MIRTQGCAHEIPILHCTSTELPVAEADIEFYAAVELQKCFCPLEYWQQTSVFVLHKYYISSSVCGAQVFQMDIHK